LWNLATAASVGKIIYMRWPSLLFFSAISLIGYTWFTKIKIPGPVRATPANAPASPGIKPNVQAARLEKYCASIKTVVKKDDYNTNYCFLVDMKLPSGSNRFFVYDIKRDTVVKAGLVTHGYGPNNRSISFSNVPGSNCTSLGKYKIGKAYHGRFGLAYKLYGLDRSNSNAFNRFVVLHSHDCVPDTEVAPQSICMSQGCPTVSPAFLTELKTYLDKAEKPLLLYLFY
jgi:hypothetical protein